MYIFPAALLTMKARKKGRNEKEKPFGNPQELLPRLPISTLAHLRLERILLIG